MQTDLAARRVVHYSDASTAGGAEQMIIHMLAAIDRRRWTPVLLHHGGSGLSDLVERCRELDVSVVEISRDGTRRAIRGLVRQIRPAIFHAHLNWAFSCSDGLIGAALARSPRVVATQHLLVPIQSRRRVLRHQILSTVVDRYLAVSRHLARMLRRICLFGEKKIRVVHNGIPMEPFDRAARSQWLESLAATQGRPIVLTVARLAAQKGIEDLIDAACRIPEAFFVIAGDGPDRARLEAKADACNVRERVAFLGYRRDVPELLAGCDLFVLPSLYEGLPVSVLEAMASKKPVIATAIGGTDEAVEDGITGLLVPPADSVALTRAIRRLLGDRPFADRLAREARKRVQREFSSTATAAAVEQVYREALGEAC